jgi:CRP/FNR family transcriptional regulator, anaerobic regulatory protein
MLTDHLRIRGRRAATIPSARRRRIDRRQPAPHGRELLRIVTRRFPDAIVAPPPRRIVAPCRLTTGSKAMDTPFASTAIEFPGTRQPFAGLQPDLDIEQLQRYMAVTRRKVRAGQYLYRNGQPFSALFLVYAGFLKTCELSEDGREQVTGFRMRGDLLGVESIGLEAYSCDAIALDDCEIWELPYPPVLGACLRIPELQVRLTAALAEEIRRDRAWMLTIGTLPAEQRVAAFLLDVATRHARLGFSSSHFILRMGRADIASFLALKHETVSRALSHLEQLGYISVLRREVKVLDAARLRAHSGTPCRVN